MKYRSLPMLTLILVAMIALGVVSSEVTKMIRSSGIMSYPSLEKLYVEGNIIRDRHGEVFLIGCHVRGQAQPPVRGFDDPYTLADSDSTIIKGYGFNVIRLPCYWAVLEKSQSSSEFVYNLTVMEKIRSTVKIYNSKGIYVIVCVMTYNSDEGMAPLSKFIPVLGSEFAASFFNDTSLTSGREHLARLWETLTTYIGDSNGVLYDLMNEPLCSDPAISRDDVGRYWLGIADYVTSRIRAKNDDHPVVVGMAPWPSSCRFLTRKLVDTNVIYKPHFYIGITSNWGVTISDLTELRNTWNDSTYQGPSKMRQFSDVPFLMGEWGSGENVAEGTINDVWLENVLTLYLEQANIRGWSYFCYIKYAYEASPRSGGWMDEIVAYASGKPTTVHFG